MNEGRNLVKEAVEDANALRKAATDAAMTDLIEKLSPRVKSLVENAIRGQLKNEDSDRIRRGVQDNWPGESHTGFEEGKDKGEQPMDDKMKKGEEGGEKVELDLEALIGMFPGLSEVEEDPADLGMSGAPADESSGIPALGETYEGEEEPKMEGKKDKKDDEEKNMDEEIEISEEQLTKVYENAMKAVNEVQVTKSFGEMSKAGELDEVDPSAGIADVKKGEHEWDKEAPPAKQDYTMKEVRRLIASGLQENKALRKALAEAHGVVQKLHGQLVEVNLFNNKVLHVNRILNKNTLTKEQKKVVMESIDSARSIDEVKTIAEALNKTFAVALTEGRNPRKPAANAQKARSSGAPNEKVLRESVDRNENDQAFSRLKQLAGLTK